ncbi:MAG: hypothetical protein GF365_02395 [Candidatus Buchananbacteria bacterium]|nr:hypothetical protein [Candidatus Buchananbacteria bacterium]
MKNKKQPLKNIKFCSRGDKKVRITGWQKKCAACQHGVFVAIRGYDSDNNFICLPQVYLFACPHASCSNGCNKFIESPLQIEVDLLHDDSLDWQNIARKDFDKLQKAEYAILSRKQWFEVLRIPAPPIITCPKCQKP